MIRRGQVWRYKPVVDRPGRSGMWLIVSTDALNHDEDFRVVLALELFGADPGGLLAVQLDTDAWVSATTIGPIQKARLVEHVATADAETMDRVAAALRSAQEL